MRYLCTFIILTFNLSVCAALTPPLENAALQNSSYSFYAKYVDGDDIISVNPALRLTPASTVKLFTTAAALSLLGPETTFKTRLYYDGKKNIFGTLRGNIYIAGGGDPALGSSRIKNNPDMDAVLSAWADSVKNAGIKKISGAVYADNSYFEGLATPRKFAWEDIGNYYGARADTLNFNDNSFKIYFKPSTAPDMAADIARTVPEVQGLTIKNHILSSSDSADNAYIFGAPGKMEIEIYGTIPAVNYEFSINAALPNPPLFAAQSLVQTLGTRGIKTEEGAKVSDVNIDYSGKTRLYEITSPSVLEIINVINKKSFNLYAEVMLKQLAAAFGRRADTESGVDVIMKFLEAHYIDTNDTVLYDGSGLSRSNITNAKTIVSLLEIMTKEKNFDLFYNSLLIPEDGDRKYFARVFARSSALKTARIKTGTNANARAYAGYAKDKQGRMIAFCFIVNNYTVATPAISAIFDKLVIQMSNLEYAGTASKKFK
ncbi:MAG: D-alanyl-D-alanine carboxypeptidase/D-alanyl-D-alanine-endopeptidase [Elusimicrobium sp.]|jgi:D-alanyl-D-alanine carboxypeptidase/D-alanyl-D-alanine-endopeptidase (penicillin-binding protein 4)|nr:D-alanyl-D-alanine carboxypeptidase/D-alanyl-D-alanine-endopeptidase [Elusimicrobium sp.]